MDGSKDENSDTLICQGAGFARSSMQSRLVRLHIAMWCYFVWCKATYGAFLFLFLFAFCVLQFSCSEPFRVLRRPGCRAIMMRGSFLEFLTLNS